MTKQEEGRVGEAIVLRALADHGFAGAEPANAKISNYAVDIKHAEGVVEVKTGMVSNGATAQQWRATIGQPGKEETAWLKTASPADKAARNATKRQAILDRKEKARMELQTEIGRPASAHTVALIIDPDKQIADVHIMQGFHLRVGWKSELARNSYVGSYRYAEASEKAAHPAHPAQPADEEDAEQRAPIPAPSPVPPAVQAEFERELDRYIDAWKSELREKLRPR